MHITYSLLNPLLLAFSTFCVSALPSDNVARAENVWTSTEYDVAGVGKFTNKATYTFSGSKLPSGNHIFLARNVAVRDGYLQIKVPGGQNPASASDQAITAGEVFTGKSNILYGSVRTRMILSSVPGTCQSAFFYKSDRQESDIEFLSDPTSLANTGGRARLHYTNQAINGGDSTSVAEPAPADVGTAEHEYRLDWTSQYTAFYIDGILQQKLTDNMPTQAGTWLWNNWANGDNQWSLGPPQKDSVMKIKSIEMYYNTTSTA